jgi:hypothetical protein
VSRKINAVLTLGLSKHHKVAPLSALARNVQRADAGLNVMACFGT